MQPHSNSFTAISLSKPLKCCPHLRTIITEYPSQQKIKKQHEPNGKIIRQQPLIQMHQLLLPFGNKITNRFLYCKRSETEKSNFNLVYLIWRRKGTSTREMHCVGIINFVETPYKTALTRVRNDVNRHAVQN